MNDFVENVANNMRKMKEQKDLKTIALEMDDTQDKIKDEGADLIWKMHDWAKANGMEFEGNNFDDNFKKVKEKGGFTQKVDSHLRKWEDLRRKHKDLIRKYGKEYENIDEVDELEGTFEDIDSGYYWYELGI